MVSTFPASVKMCAKLILKKGKYVFETSKWVHKKVKKENGDLVCASRCADQIGYFSAFLDPEILILFKQIF